MTIRLTNPREDRYERFRLIRWWDQEKIADAKVLVLGAGALGNEVVKNLALLGIGKAYIADFDKIETSNLTRSPLFRQDDVGSWKADVLAMRAHDLNPDCDFQSLRSDVRYHLGLGFLSDLDLVFGCLDNREARYYVNRYCYLLEKTYIDGGLDTLNGSITIFHPPQTACYECTLTSVDRSELQKRISCLKSFESEIKQHVPTAPTIASIIGGIQTQIGVRALHGLEIPQGKRIGLYGLSDVFFEIQLEKSQDCGLHSTMDPIPGTIEMLSASENDSLLKILSVTNEKYQAESLSWDFDRDLIVGLQCTECGKAASFVGTYSRFDGSDRCECGGTFKPEIANGFNGSEPWGNQSFRNLGFPSDHIYCTIGSNGRIFFRLEK